MGHRPLKIEVPTPARVATLDPSGSRPSSRAGRDPRPERDATLVPSGTQPLSRAGRDHRARRLEHLEQDGSNLSSSVARPTRAGKAVFLERGMQCSPSEVNASLKDNAPATAGGLGGLPPSSVKGKGEVLGEGRENCSEQLSLPSPKGMLS